MSKKHSFLMFALFLIFTFSSQIFSQNISDQKDEQLISQSDYRQLTNDRLVMHALRTINSAELTYAATFGAGRYGTFSELLSNGLIDAVLASGEKYGYRFTLSIGFVSTITLPSFEVQAVSVIKSQSSLSFYINENCEIRGAYKFGRLATIKDSVIESCTVFPRSENENLVILSMRTIYSAQMTYAATYGNGNFGTIDQLYNTNLVTSGFALSSIYRGYISSMATFSQTSTTPAHFNIRTVPISYNRAGTRSFYINESGVLHGADKQGQPADENDPPIE